MVENVNFPKQSWRFIPLLSASGAMQMAIDTWLLEQHRRGNSPSILRFYTWSPIALSLGYHQHRYPETWNTLKWKEHSVDVVRRPSGGRAVLHQGDLTYAIITSESEILGTNSDRPHPGESQRSYVYRTLCQFLLNGMQSLGLELHYGNAGRGYIHNPNCFGTATAADLTLSNGTKLIGSAQLKRGNAILQHGSIRINPDFNLFQQVFGAKVLHPNKKPEETTDITRITAATTKKIKTTAEKESTRTGEVLQPLTSHLQHFSKEQIINTLTTAACQCFGINGIVQPLSPQEWNTIFAQSQKWHMPNHD